MNTDIIKTYKRFDKDMSYLGFQYKVGKEYDKYDDIKFVGKGFIGWKCPIKAWDYCDIAECRFALVEQSGIISENKEGMSLRSSHIKIIAELTLIDMIKASIEWIKENASQSTGDDGSRIKSTRYNDNIITNASNSVVYSNGVNATIACNGMGAKIASLGIDDKIVLNNILATLVSSGSRVCISSNSQSSNIISSGSYANISSCGLDSHICSMGTSAIINSSGRYTNICSLGKNANIICTGIDNKVRAKIGSLITLTEYKWVHGSKVVDCIKTEKVDGERIKADTWYQLKDGEFFETEL